MEALCHMQKVKGGVPISIFDGDRDCGFIPGLSGKSILRYSATAYLIGIFDVADPKKFYFAAFLSDDTLSFEVRNRGYNGYPKQKHPDIYPKELLKRAIEHFEGRGKIVRFLVGHWQKVRIDDPNAYSDNYVSYITYLNNISAPSDEDKKRAAFSTWTGQRARELDFTTISEISEEKDAIIVCFERSSKSSTTSSF